MESIVKLLVGLDPTQCPVRKILREGGIPFEEEQYPSRTVTVPLEHAHDVQSIVHVFSRLPAYLHATAVDVLGRVATAAAYADYPIK